MALITIQEFADLHGVHVKAIEYQLRNGLKKHLRTKYGKRLISDSVAYTPHTRGVKPSKLKRK